MKLVEKYGAFIIDLDGVLYLVREPIDGSVAAIKKLQDHRKPFVFLTNNSSATVVQYMERFKAMGLIIDEDQLVTSGQALASYINGNWDTDGKTALLIGGEGLRKELEAVGLEIVDFEQGWNADFVVVGWDGDFHYRKLKAAVIAIRNGANYLATNTDATYPTVDGLWPGAGTMVAAITTGAGREPFITGKPNKLIVELALKRMGSDRDKTLMIGDKLETDILAGANSEVDTLLVLTGVSKVEDIENTGIKPTYIRDNLAAIFD